MFEQIIGHDRQKELLQREIDTDNVGHAYLFSGIDGIGKKMLASAFLHEIIQRGISKEDGSIRRFGDQHADMVTIGDKDAAIKINEIREISALTAVKPLEGSARGILIDHADRMTDQAQNALLKTIEEPAPGNVFVLITDKPDQLLPTIASRCRKVKFADLQPRDKAAVLRQNGYQPAGLHLDSTLEELTRMLQDPGYLQKLQGLYDRFLKVVQGDVSELFALAEECSVSSELSRDAVLFFIKNLHGDMLASDAQTQIDLIDVQDGLFELLDKLQYNVSLRLQWESCLIKTQIRRS